MSGCPNDSHVHTIPPALMAFHGYAVLDHSRDFVVLTRDRAVADRVAELINRHGLTDVPDDASELLAPWPPPDSLDVAWPSEIATLPADPTKEHQQ